MLLEAQAGPVALPCWAHGCLWVEATTVSTSYQPKGKAGIQARCHLYILTSPVIWLHQLHVCLRNAVSFPTTADTRRMKRGGRSPHEVPWGWFFHPTVISSPQEAAWGEMGYTDQGFDSSRLTATAPLLLLVYWSIAFCHQDKVISGTYLFWPLTYFGANLLSPDRSPQPQIQGGKGWGAGSPTPGDPGLLLLYSNPLPQALHSQGRTAWMCPTEVLNVNFAKVGVN